MSILSIFRPEPTLTNVKPQIPVAEEILSSLVTTLNRLHGSALDHEEEANRQEAAAKEAWDNAATHRAEAKKSQTVFEKLQALLDPVTPNE